MLEPVSHTTKRLIKWGECDPAGIVYYPRYFEMFDANTNALFAAVTGLGKRELQEKYEIVGWPMVDSSAKFFTPATYGDPVRVTTFIERFGKSSMDIRHKLTHADGREIAEGGDKRVWVARDPENPKGIKAKDLPEEFTQKFFDQK